MRVQGHGICQQEPQQKAEVTEQMSFAQLVLAGGGAHRLQGAGLRVVKICSHPGGPDAPAGFAVPHLARSEGDGLHWPGLSREHRWDEGAELGEGCRKGLRRPARKASLS